MRRTSAVSRGAAKRASSSSVWPCWSAVRTSIGRLNGLRLALLFEFFGLKVGGQRFNKGLEFALHHLVQLMHGEADAVIGDAILREVVSADLLAAIAGSHHAAPLRANFFLLLFEFELVQPRAQHAQTLGSILDLRFLVLAGDHQPRGQVSK